MTTKTKTKDDTPMDTEEVSEGFTDVLPDDVHSETAGLSLAERLERIRQARGYIQKEMIKSVGHSAVTHDHLLEVVRPLFIMWGVRWKSVACELMAHDVVQYESNGKHVVIFTELLRWTFRFKRTEDPDPRGDQRQKAVDYEDVIVVSRGLDRQAKDAGGAMTYAEKYALMEVMNLGRGDDPDLTPVDLSPQIPAEIEARVATIRGILDADEGVSDTDAALRDIATGWGKHYGRKVQSIYSLGPDDLDRTIRQLTRKAAPKPTKKVDEKPADDKADPDVIPGVKDSDIPF